MFNLLLKKRLLRFAILLVVVLSTALQGKALESFEVDYTSYGLLYEITGDSEVSVGYSWKQGEPLNVEIPEIVSYNNKEYRVISIRRSAFHSWRGLISITIPESVTSIGDYAFMLCSSLTSITIPESVASIGELVFYECTSLESISVNANNLYYSSIDGVLFDKQQSILYTYPSRKSNDSYVIPESVTTIGSNAFSACVSLTSVTIPASVTSVAANVFHNCSSLESISVNADNLYYSSIDGVLFDKQQTTLRRYPAGKSNSYIIPESVTTIGSCAFSGCSSLVSVTIPVSVTSIGNNAFNGCATLTSITIPESVTSLGSFVFYGCSSLKSVTIPESVTSIAEFAFDGCRSLQSVTIPASVTSIADSAFEWCSSLKSINIPESVTTIGNSVFYGCSSLKSVTIPESVTSIAEGAFLNCSNLYIAKICSDNIFVSNIDNRRSILAVPQSKLNEYREAYPNNKVIPVDEIGFEPDSYELAVKPNEPTALSLFIDEFENVNGFQMDVALPEGLAIAETEGKLAVSFGDGTAAASHTITASKVAGSNKYRIVAYSSKNEPFLAGENLLNVAVVADANFKGGEINVADVFISTTDGEGYQGIDFSINAKVDYALSIGDDISLEEGETWQLAPVVNPSIEGLTLDWSSTNPDVAYIDADGMLHAVAPGEAVITASNSEYGISASINVTVTSILYGDANDNGIVTIDDVVTDVHYILEKDPQPFSFRKADVNKDARINIIDVSKTVAIVLANETQPQALRAHLCGVVGPGASLSAENIRLDADGRAVMTLRLNGDADITALQGDIRLPEGMRISNISMAGEQKGDHIISFAELKNGATRFAVYSMSLAGVTANSALIEVELESDNLFVEGEASVDDIYVSDTDCNLLRMESVTVDVSGASAVNEISADPNAPADVYNMQGVLILRNASESELNALTPGLYIVNGKKVQIR